jgi:mRNA interferase MazF
VAGQLKRGDLVVVSAAGDYGKPRTAVIIQSDLLNKSDSVLVALLTSTLADTPLFRLTVEPTAENGLKLPSQVMVDKIIAYPREKCGIVIGSLDQATLIALNHMLAVMVGIAD